MSLAVIAVYAGAIFAVGIVIGLRNRSHKPTHAAAVGGSHPTAHIAGGGPAKHRRKKLRENNREDDEAVAMIATTP